MPIKSAFVTFGEIVTKLYCDLRIGCCWTCIRTFAEFVRQILRPISTGRRSWTNESWTSSLNRITERGFSTCVAVWLVAIQKSLCSPDQLPPYDVRPLGSSRRSTVRVSVFSSFSAAPSMACVIVLA